MKTIRPLLFGALCALCALTRAATVTVDAAGFVFVDGAAYGKPADAIANNRDLAPAIQRALDASFVETRTLIQTVVDSAASIVKAEKEAAEKVKAEASAAQQRAEAKAADAEARLASVIAQIELLDPLVLPLPLDVKLAVIHARESLAAQQRAQLEKQQAEISAKLSALKSQP